MLSTLAGRSEADCQYRRLAGRPRAAAWLPCDHHFLDAAEVVRHGDGAGAAVAHLEGGLGHDLVAAPDPGLVDAALKRRQPAHVEDRPVLAVAGHREVAARAREHRIV